MANGMTLFGNFPPAPPQVQQAPAWADYATALGSRLLQGGAPGGQGLGALGALGQDFRQIRQGRDQRAQQGYANQLGQFNAMQSAGKNRLLAEKTRFDMEAKKRKLANTQQIMSMFQPGGAAPQEVSAPQMTPPQMPQQAAFDIPGAPPGAQANMPPQVGSPAGGPNMQPRPMGLPRQPVVPAMQEAQRFTQGAMAAAANGNTALASSLQAQAKALQDKHYKSPAYQATVAAVKERAKNAVLDPNDEIRLNNQGQQVLTRKGRDKREDYWRKEIKPIVDDLQDTNRKIRLVETAVAKGTGTGDLAAVNAFQRLIDDGVVRGEDVALQRETAGLYELLNQWTSGAKAKGELLPPEVRTRMLDTARALGGSTAQTYKTRIDGMRETVEGTEGINWGRVYPKAFDKFFSYLNTPDDKSGGLTTTKPMPQ